MHEPFTDSTGDRVRRGATNGAAWEKNSEFNDSCSSAYYPNIEESGSTRTAPVRYQPGTSNQGSHASWKSTPSDLAMRDAVRRAVCRAVDQTDRMIEAAKVGDAMELSNAGFDLVNVLEELWTLRADREPNWRDLLNLLQGALCRNTSKHILKKNVLRLARLCPSI